MKRGYFTLLVAILIIAAFTSPVFAEPTAKKIKVVATMFPYADWTAQIGGDHVDVVCLLKPGISPHTYELTTRDLKAVQDARLLIYNGLGLDDWAAKTVESSARGLIKLDLARHLPLVAMPTTLAEKTAAENHDRDHAHDDSTTGCGMWLDPVRAVRMIDLIAEMLSLIDPAHKEDYQKNVKIYFSQLDRLDRQFRLKLDPKKGGVVCFHEDFVYLFRRYGVEVYGVVEPYPGKEPSVQYIRKLTQLVAGKPLRYVMTEPQLSEKPARVVADQLKVPLVTVDPIGGIGVPQRDSYIRLMTYNLERLTKN